MELVEHYHLTFNLDKHTKHGFPVLTTDLTTHTVAGAYTLHIDYIKQGTTIPILTIEMKPQSLKKNALESHTNAEMAQKREGSGD